MTISTEWGQAIANYVAWQRLAGRPSTTLYTRRQHLEHLARRVYDGPWALTPDDLAGYAAQQNWENETRRGRRATFRDFWAWGIDRGHTTSDISAILPAVKPGDPDPRPVPDGVYHRALERADVDEEMWIDLAAEHGLRRAEIAKVHSRNIVPTLVGYDLEVDGKGSKWRVVPLTPTMARWLLDIVDRQGPGYLWPGEEDGHISARWLGTRVTRLLDGDWTIHKLRHRAATRFWEISGHDPYAVAELMGWANLNMVRRYVRQSTTRLRAIVEGASRVHAPVG